MIEKLPVRLKESRLRCGMTRKQVAERLGVTVSVIGMYENGERSPSLPALMKLSSYYKVSIDYLLDNHAAPEGTLSLDGLTEKQIQAVRLLADSIRNPL